MEQTEVKFASGQFSGTPVDVVRTSDVVMVESLLRPGYRLKRHSHAHSCFCLVIEGSFEEVYGDKHRSCAKNTLLFRPSDERHLDNFGAVGARCFNVEISPPLLSRVTDHTSLKLE